jgi:hypothetical protein
MKPDSKFSPVVFYAKTSLKKSSIRLKSRSRPTLKGISSLFTTLAALSLVSCSDGTMSDVKVTNGKPTLAFPAVVEIQQGKSSCSATFIRPDVLLTAAHCIDRDGPPIAVPSLKIASEDFVAHPDFPTKIDKDVGLIFFDHDVASATMPLQFVLPTKGDSVTLVGYGNNRYVRRLLTAGANGVKRTGTNKVALVNDLGITLVGTPDAFPEGEMQATGENSSGAPGDSGGPLLSTAGEILGIASYISRSDSTPDVETTYATLTNVRDFLEQHLARSGKKPNFVATCEANFKNPLMQLLVSTNVTDLSCMTLFAHVASEAHLTVIGLSKDQESMDLNLLQDLKWLESMVVIKSKIENLEKISQFKNLQQLTLINPEIKDYSLLKESWSLTSVNVVESDAVDMSPLKEIPNISTLVINGLAVQDINPVRHNLFAGSRTKDCGEILGGVTDGFHTETLEYEPKNSQIKVSTKVYRDKDCTGSVVMEMDTAFEVLSLSPHDLPETYKLDLKDLNKKSITVFDDSLFSDEFRLLFKNVCPYVLGVRTTSCKLSSPLEPFTLVKKSGENLWFGMSDHEELSPGSSKATRHKDLDPRAFRLVTP